MKRIKVKSRQDYVKRLQALGVPNPVYESDRGTMEKDWLEGVAYEFTSAEIAKFQKASSTVAEIIGRAMVEVAEKPLFLGPMAIPPQTQRLIQRSWNAKRKALAMRLDWSVGADGRPKLLDIKSECYDSLLLAARGQADFLASHPGAGQWNTIEADLCTMFSAIKAEIGQRPMHFAQDGEDVGAGIEVNFLKKLASEAGIRTHWVDFDSIGLTADGRYFADGDNRTIDILYQWARWCEQLDSDFGARLFETNAPSIQFLEPLWSMALNNKAFLAMLWRFTAGDSPYLLPTFLSNDPAADSLGDTFVEKPIYGWDAGNIRIVVDEVEVAKNVDLEMDSRDGTVYQSYCPLPEFAGHRPVISTWLVSDPNGWMKPSGLSVREGEGPITTYYAPFVPHLVRD